MKFRAALSDLSGEEWDVIVVGGGASGLSVGWDAASRGLRVCVLEGRDWAGATSSRSTKLIHGGVRYLQKLELDLVKEAVVERQRLLRNAGEFCHPIRFMMPVSKLWQKYFYRTGLALYDHMAGFTLQAKDGVSGQELELKSKAIVNATGIFSDDFRERIDVECRFSIQHSRGSHIVIPRQVSKRATAIVIPKTSDGRVLFAIPWMGYTIIGTTDVACARASCAPRPSDGEIDFLLSAGEAYFGVKRAEVTSCWAGIRPLVSKRRGATKALSRKHVVEVSESGVVSLLGGKWTTARKMGEDVVDALAMRLFSGLERSRTHCLSLTDHGAGKPANEESCVKTLARDYGVTCVEDVLGRRWRTLFTDAALAGERAELVARELGSYFSWDEEKIQQQIKGVRTVTSSYLL